MGLQFYRHGLSMMSLLLLSSCLPPSASPGVSGSQAAGLATMNLAKNHQQSPIIAAPNPYHWAIDGVGYFSVIDKETQELLFTRNGNFMLDNKGQITTSDGKYYLDPAITVPSNHTAFVIDETGGVWSQQPSDTEWTQLGRITLSRVPYPENLTALGERDGYFKATQASGAAEVGQAGQNQFGRVVGTALEDFKAAIQKLPAGPCKSAAGPQIATDNPLDVAIEGQGYFVLLNPATGESYFSRQGALRVADNREPRSLTATGMLIDQHGYSIEVQRENSGSLHLTDKQTLERIDEQGQLWVKEGTETKSIGRLRLAKIKNTDLIEPVGFARQNVYRAKELGGVSEQDLELGLAGANGFGTLKSKTLEDCGLDILYRP